MGYRYRGTDFEVPRENGPARGWVPFDPSKCGERRGYRQHQRHSQPPCDRCSAANTAYLAERRAAIRAATPPRPVGVIRPACGTNKAYYHHLRHGTLTCAPCRAAHTAHQAAYEAQRRAA